MSRPSRTRPQFLSAATAAVCALALGGCAQEGGGGLFAGWRDEPPAICEVDAVLAEKEQAQAFRRAETERAEQLEREIERLQADLRTAESALVEVESGLAGRNGRADAVSSLAVTRIQVERAASQAPWRIDVIEGAREKLEEAERQVAEGRFGAALFFVYRARRLAEGVLDEARQVVDAGNARLIRARRVNLRAGPSTEQRVLSVLEAGTPVIPQSTEGGWTLVQVTGGPAGWVHDSLLGSRFDGAGSNAPASPSP